MISVINHASRTTLNFLFCLSFLCALICFFFFNDTATTEIYPLSLHDAFPISAASMRSRLSVSPATTDRTADSEPASVSSADRKSTRLNSSHSQISYAVFCLKKKMRQALPLLHFDRGH